MGRLDYYSKLIGQAPQESDTPKSFADLTPTKRTSARPHHRETNVYSHTFLVVWEPRRKKLSLFDNITVWIQ